MVLRYLRRTPSTPLFLGLWPRMRKIDTTSGTPDEVEVESGMRGLVLHFYSMFSVVLGQHGTIPEVILKWLQGV